MIDFLLGVPAKLSAIAAQITGLGSVASQASVTSLGSPAQASTITTLAANCGTPLQAVSPIAMPPKQDGLLGTYYPFRAFPNPALNQLMSALVFNSSSTTDETIVNVTGKGVLNYLGVASASSLNTVTLIIDGVTLFSGSPLSANTHAAVIIGCLFHVDASDLSKYGVSLDQIPFNSSLIIKHHSSNTNTVKTYVKYRVTG